MPALTCVPVRTTKTLLSMPACTHDALILFPVSILETKDHLIFITTEWKTPGLEKKKTQPSFNSKLGLAHYVTQFLCYVIGNQMGGGVGDK